MGSKPMMMGLEREVAHFPNKFGTLSLDILRRMAHPGIAKHWFFCLDGGKMYFDCNHLEGCTPECDGPYELLACSRVLDNRMFNSDPGDLRFTKCNHVSGYEETFGSHESYSTSLPIGTEALYGLLSFMASRHLISGEGGRHPRGSQLCISPRLCYVRRNFATGTTGERPLINTRDESHGDTANRLHLIIGGDNMSDRSLVLKFGTTALAIRTMELDEHPIIPLDSYYTSWADFAQHNNEPTDETIAVLARLQEAWLLAAERAYKSHQSHFPSWTERVLDEWRFVLERFIRGEESELDTVLDWRIKNRLIRGFLQSRGEFVNCNGISRYMGEIDELCFKYGTLSPDGIFWKIRDRLDASLPEGSHNKRYHVPEGRAKLRVAMMENFQCHGMDWSTFIVAYESMRLHIVMNDAASERCALHDSAYDCADCRYTNETGRARLTRHFKINNFEFATAEEAVATLKSVGVH